MYDAYVNIFRRCGLHAMAVEADTGDMGGSSSHEFMIPSDSGEDAILEAEDGSYAANMERAEGICDLTNEFPGADQPLEAVPTPDVWKIEDAAAFFETEARRMVKCLIYQVNGEAVAVLLPGDREVNEIKLHKVLPGAELAEPELIREVTGAEVGFAGPVGLQIPVYADVRLKGLRGGIVGGPGTDVHSRNFDIDRDAEIREYVDIVFPKTGDLAPNGKARLQEKRGVEVGHVFKLGTKYSEALGANYLDENGKSHPMVMGCYGIGVSRTLQAVIEQSHDDFGIIWPVSVAPFEVLITVLNPTDEACMAEAQKVKGQLEAAGVDVLLDDRDERPGFKFKDADLLGLPLRLTVGARGLAKGEMELKARTDKEFTAVALGDAGAQVLSVLQQMREALA
jgi:prolyl-tRNA synthetase